MLKKILSSLTVAIGFTCLSRAQTLYAPNGSVGASSNSNVGIGISSPSSRLAVDGRGNFGGGPLYIDWTNELNWGGSASKWAGYIGFNAYRNDNDAKDIYYRDNRYTNMSVFEGSHNGFRWLFKEFSNNELGQFQLQEVMSINKNGNVGVGVATPTTKLEVSGSIRSVGGSLHATLSNNDLQFNRANNLAYISNVASGGALAFTTSGGSSNTRMFIGGNGNIGIGTTSPGSYKLAVEGKIGAHEIKVTTAGWADFVFKDDYVLRPLAEVEQFIKEKGHLPDVPSEAEVLEHGIELGAMDAKLLQKIEELTLYNIEQEKRLNQKDQELQELRNEIAEIKALLKQ